MSDRVKDELEIFTGNSNPALAREVAKHLDVSLGEAEVGRFPDGEVMIEVRENVRGGDCFIIQSICTPPNENLMELILLITDALRRASAGRITAVIPYFGYSRQDRKVAPRVPISAKLVADLITTAGVNRVLTVDLHAGPDPGLLQYPGRQPLRDAGVAHATCASESTARKSRWCRPTRAASNARAPTRGGSMRTSRLSTSGAGAPAKSPRCSWSAK